MVTPLQGGKRPWWLLAATALLLLLAAVTPTSAARLSPPWWVTYDLYQEALRLDKCLNISALEAVEPPGEPASFAFNITLICSNASEAKLRGLATYLTVSKDYGGTLFASRVLDASGRRVKPVRPKSAEQALELAAAALQGHPWFVRTAVSSPLPCMRLFWVVFTPEVAQVWIDNLADLYGNINLLAAQLFDRVMALERFGLRATTRKFTQPDVYWPGRRPGGSQQRHEHAQQGQQAVACAPGGGCYPAAVTEADRRWGDAEEGGSTEAAGSAAAPLRRPAVHVPRPYEALSGDELAAEELAQWDEDAAASAAGVEKRQARTSIAAQQGDGLAAGQLQLSEVEQLWRHDQKQQQQAQQVALAGGLGRRQLAWQHAGGEPTSSDGRSADGTAGYSWDVAAKCWAVAVARRFGGEPAALRVADWLV